MYAMDHWQSALSKGFQDPMAVLDILGLRPEQRLPHATAHAAPIDIPPFPFRVPRGYVARMERGDPQDPLLRQVLPLAEEHIQSPGYTRDPLNERGALRAPGVLQKYQGRVLLVTTTACAIHCRYCFRRHFSHGDGHYADNDPHFRAALTHIRRDNTLREVILSGGDPLCLVDEKLAALARGLADIPHVGRLRIHTRLPIVLPERVDEALLAWLTETVLGRRSKDRKGFPFRSIEHSGDRGLEVVVVVHANHPNEIDEAVVKALTRLRRAGVLVLNQSVLLRGVNDNEDSLVRLNERLFTTGALPYYLHMLDPVAGSRHFAVEEERAKMIMAELRARLPGYLVPRRVREVAGARYKVPID
uniref:L-lysine 2,3-aminomutase n=1 Tax=Candidatus Kentrum eta TaxID=2126337 RepID=A0A450UBS2_9GAMM|nr:MAG: L-lysine 2,3-aminomutase [Candidatus Kentron sp. H]VFJ89567.1 MAG: L-lysine 2,3-aminomutase [Candidatus Kentron sp. H]VFJ96265.1 MAG: L-lysine 2,3-aminomutase [Candidatus Kentron sp. H]